MGSKSKSSTSSATANNDNRQVFDASGGGLVSSGQGNIINVTDGSSETARLQQQLLGTMLTSSVQSQTNANLAQIKFNADAAKGLFDFAGDTNQAAFKSVNDALGIVGGAFNSLSEQASGSKQVSMVALAAVGAVVALVVLKKG